MKQILIINLALLPEYRGIRTIPLLWDSKDKHLEFEFHSLDGSEIQGVLYSPYQLLTFDVKIESSKEGGIPYKFDFLELLTIKENGVDNLSDTLTLKRVNISEIQPREFPLYTLDVPALNNQMESFTREWSRITREITGFFETNLRADFIDVSELLDNLTGDLPHEAHDIEPSGDFENILTDETRFLILLDEDSGDFNTNDDGDLKYFTKEELFGVLEKINPDPDFMEFVRDSFIITWDEESFNHEQSIKPRSK